MREDVRWKPNTLCRKEHGLWSAPSKMATEYEVTAFIAALVRLTKPSVVVETGTFEGHTTVVIAQALRENGAGHVWTFEIDEERARAAAGLLAVVGNATVVPHAITEGSAPDRIEVAFLDSHMASRADDMRVVWPRVTLGGIVLVHDANPNRPPWRVRPPAPHHVFHFATPRGLLAYQKPW